jgi:hypothetical protein
VGANASDILIRRRNNQIRKVLGGHSQYINIAWEEKQVYTYPAIIHICISPTHSSLLHRNTLKITVLFFRFALFIFKRNYSFRGQVMKLIGSLYVRWLYILHLFLESDTISPLKQCVILNLTAVVFREWNLRLHQCVFQTSLFYCGLNWQNIHYHFIDYFIN